MEHYVKQKKPENRCEKNRLNAPLGCRTSSQQTARRAAENRTLHLESQRRNTKPIRRRSAKPERYEHPIPSREALLKHLSDRAQLLTAETLAQELGLTQSRDFDALTKTPRRDGARRAAHPESPRRVRRVVALDLIPGSIIANSEGFGFLRPDAGVDDIYLSPAEMRKVMHGDRVLGNIVGADRRGRKQGAIAEVLERRMTRLVGRIVIQDGGDRRGARRQASASGHSDSAR